MKVLETIIFIGLCSVFAFWIFVAALFLTFGMGTKEGDQTPEIAAQQKTARAENIRKMRDNDVLFFDPCVSRGQQPVSDCVKLN